MIQTTVRMPEELYRQLKEESRTRGISVNSLILAILWNTIHRAAGR